MVRVQSKAGALGMLYWYGPLALFLLPTLTALENRGGQWTKAPTLDSISQAQTSLQSRPKKLCKDHLMGDPSVLKIS